MVVQKDNARQIGGVLRSGSLLHSTSAPDPESGGREGGRLLMALSLEAPARPVVSSPSSTVPAHRSGSRSPKRASPVRNGPYRNHSRTSPWRFLASTRPPSYTMSPRTPSTFVSTAHAVGSAIAARIARGPSL